MKYWYYSKVINHLIENTAINSGNISLVIKEIGNILGKDISLQLEDNLPYSKLLKLSCPPFTIYKLSLFGKDYFYNENETLCPCADKINTNNNFICQHLLSFLLLKKSGLFEEEKIEATKMNEIIKIKQDNILRIK